MGLVVLPKTLVAHTDAAAADVMADLNAIVAAVNGGLDSENLAATVRAALAEAGDIKATGRAAAPSGWLMCEGQAVSRTTYAALFAAIGTAYGAGNGTTTFNVPDLRGRTPIGADGGVGRLDGTIAPRNLGQSGGEMWSQSHSHSSGAMGTSIESVNHTHNLGMFQATRHEGTGFAYNEWSVGGNTLTGGESAFHTHAVVGTTAAEQKGTKENMPPYQIVNWLIKI